METKQKKRPAKEERTVLKRGGRQEERRDAPSADEILVGRNAVFEALKAGRGINRILVAQGAKEAALAPLLSAAREEGGPVRAGKGETPARVAPMPLA